MGRKKTATADAASLTSAGGAGVLARARVWGDGAEKAKKPKQGGKNGGWISDDEPLRAIGVPPETANKFANVGLSTVGDLKKARPIDLYATRRVSFGMMEKLRDAAKNMGIECPTADDAEFDAARTAVPEWIYENGKRREERRKRYREALATLEALHVAHGLPKDYLEADLDWDS